MKIFVVLAMVALAIYTFVNVIIDIDHARTAFAVQDTSGGMKIVGEVLLSVVALAAGILLVCYMW